jgi:carbonic anhydrase
MIRHDKCGAFEAEIEKLKAENKKLREALKWYADIENGNNDWGMRAREALKEIDEKLQVR